MGLILTCAIALALSSVASRSLFARARSWDRAFAVVSLWPMVLALLLPVAVMAANGFRPQAWLQPVTRLGVALSALLLVVGAILVVRAYRTRSGLARLIGVATLIAGIPALLVASGWLFQ